MREFINIVENAQESPAAEWVSRAQPIIGEFAGKAYASVSIVDDITAEIDDIGAIEMRQGWGTKLLTALCDLADRIGVNLTLGVANETDRHYDAGGEGPSEDQLISWYQRFGFEVDHEDWGNERTTMNRIIVGGGDDEEDEDIDEDASNPAFRPVKNPSDRQIVQMVQRAKEHRLRGIMFGRDFWLWDAYYAIHKEAADAIGVPYWPDGKDNRIAVNEEDGYPVFDFPADDPAMHETLLARFKNSDVVFFQCGSHGLLSGKEASDLNA